MAIQVELSPEAEARLAAEAGAHGIAPEEYAGKLLQVALMPYATGNGKLAPGDADEMTKGMTAGSEHLPILPPEVNERVSYYEDRW